jgi:hypothetical protein
LSSYLSVRLHWVISQQDGRNTECDSRVKAALMLLLLLFLLLDLGVG